MSNNKVKAWDGLDKLVIFLRLSRIYMFYFGSQKDLPVLEEVLFVGNPLEEKLSAEGTWRDEVSKKFPTLKKLDGKPIFRDDEVNEEGKAE